MATNKDLKRWYTGEGNSPKDFVRLNEEGKVDDDLIPGSGGSEGVIIEASANKTVNNYQVPQLTDEQLLQIYNAVVAGKPVTVTDATGSMHFSSLNADSVSGEIFVTMLYFDKMILEYAEGDQTTFTEIGGSADALYMHHIVINGTGNFKILSKSATPFTLLSLQTWLIPFGFGSSPYFIGEYAPVFTESQKRHDVPHLAMLYAYGGRLYYTYSSYTSKYTDDGVIFYGGDFGGGYASTISDRVVEVS